uniref:CSON005101 protein n=1 Tax=Culicoides sonorensis TaxID=179676 RepID=A0A336LYC7_CULSO
MLFIVPASPRYGSIVVALLTIAQFVFLMWAITTSYDIPESQAGFKVMVVVFGLVCIFVSLLLIIGAIKLSRKLLLPYMCTMSAFVLIYAVVFIVMLHGEHGQKDWIHLTLMALNICYLIGVGALYREILRAERPEFINITISPQPLQRY